MWTHDALSFSRGDSKDDSVPVVNIVKLNKEIKTDEEATS
jgi:hypothetical protein